MTMLLERDTIEPQIAEYVAELRDVDGCEKLWRAVIERTLLDLRYLRRSQACSELTKSQRERLRRINASPPAGFIEGAWFEEVCQYLRLDPEGLRGRVGKRFDIIPSRSMTVLPAPSVLYDSRGRCYHDGPDGGLHAGCVEECSECAPLLNREVERVEA